MPFVTPLKLWLAATTQGTFKIEDGTIEKGQKMPPKEQERLFCAEMHF